MSKQQYRSFYTMDEMVLIKDNISNIQKKQKQFLIVNF